MRSCNEKQEVIKNSKKTYLIINLILSNLSNKIKKVMTGKYIKKLIFN